MRKLHKICWIVAVAAVLCLPAVASAADVARVSLTAGQIHWDPQVEHEHLILTVSTPSGEVVRREFRAGESPVFDLATASPDGTYNYELRVVPRIEPSVRRELEAARRSGNDAAVVRRLREAGRLPGDVVQSGSFAVRQGAIVTSDEREEGGSGVRSTTAAGSVRNITAADQVIPDDLIVQQSLCVGFDCVNNESFGFDTIRLKENNTRIKFEDTSTGTFPTNDWQLTANDSASGGSSKFSIEDITGAKVPFTVTAGASTNSIFVDSTGRVGFRTSTPVLDLHVATSNTPAIRLEQNNSGGFTAQTWDIAGNEANFFVRDVTGGSRLPFRIRPGAPTSSIDISADGDVGIGIASPTEALHVNGSDGDTTLLVKETNGTAAIRTLAELNNNGGVQLDLKDTSANAGAGVTWAWQNVNAEIRITDVGDATNELVLTQAGNMTIAGSLTQGSSRSIKEEFGPVDSRDLLRRVLDLPITTWSYKAVPGVRHVGPMSEDFFASFRVGANDRGISVTDSAGVALAAIQGLHQELTARDAEIAALRTRLEELAARLEQLNATP